MWSIEKWKNQEKPSLKESLQEFNIGYIITAILAVFFMVIGWYTLYGTNTQLSNNAISFADQVVRLFTEHIGTWAYLFIAISAFATMFSTCMTAHDALARVSLDIISLLKPKEKWYSTKNAYTTGILILTFINFIVIAAFSANMGNLVALATFVSFVVAPLVGYMNLKNVTSSDLDPKFWPNKQLRFLTYVGILFLPLFALYYFYIIIL